MASLAEEIGNDPVFLALLDRLKSQLEIAVERTGVFIVPAEGGQERQLTTNPDDVHPDWSPDGRWIAFDSLREGVVEVWRVSASGGQPERLTDAPGGVPRWSPDGTQVYFIGRGTGANNVWAVSIASRKVRQVTTFTGRRGVLGRWGLAVDARYLYFTWEEGRGDIWVAEIGPQPGR
jgi:Tol biopolymer transport system component